MSWLYSRALVEAYSEENSLDGEPCAQLNLMLTQASFWRNGKMMDCSTPFLFGVTSRLLTESRGEELLKLFQVGSLAKIFLVPEEAKESKGKEVGSGLKWSALLAKYDPNTFSLKMSQHSLFEDLTQCYQILPKWGSMRNGDVYQRQQLEHPIEEKEFGLWLTPSTIDIGERSEESMQKRLDWRKTIGRNGTGAGCLAEQMQWSGEGDPVGYLTTEKQVPDNETFFHTPNTTGMDGGSNSRKALRKRLQWPTPLSRERPSEGAVLQMRKLVDVGEVSIEEAEIMLGGSLHRKSMAHWPTPSASQARSEGMIGQMRRKVELGEITREEAEKMIGGSLEPARMSKWPTPQSRDWKGESGRSAKGTEMDLPAAVKNFPTPTSRDWKGARKPETMEKTGRNSDTNSLCDATEFKDGENGRLNPSWVEWLMNWPIFWSELNVKQANGTEEGATCNYVEWFEMSRMWFNGELASASSRLQQATGSRDNLCEVSCEASPSSEDKNERVPLLSEDLYFREAQDDNVQPTLCEQIRMGKTWWDKEPNVPRVGNGLKYRTDRLKAIGNGQVPLCAAEAFRQLQERINEQ